MRASFKRLEWKIVYPVLQFNSALAIVSLLRFLRKTQKAPLQSLRFNCRRGESSSAITEASGSNTEAFLLLSLCVWFECFFLVLLKIFQLSYLCSVEIYVLRSRHFELLMLFCVTQRLFHPFTCLTSSDFQNNASMITESSLSFAELPKLLRLLSTRKFRVQTERWLRFMWSRFV